MSRAALLLVVLLSASRVDAHDDAPDPGLVCVETQPGLLRWEGARFDVVEVPPTVLEQAPILGVVAATRLGPGQTVLAGHDAVVLEHGGFHTWRPASSPSVRDVFVSFGQVHLDTESDGIVRLGPNGMCDPAGEDTPRANLRIVGTERVLLGWDRRWPGQGLHGVWVRRGTAPWTFFPLPRTTLQRVELSPEQVRKLDFGKVPPFARDRAARKIAEDAGLRAAWVSSRDEIFAASNLELLRLDGKTWVRVGPGGTEVSVHGDQAWLLSRDEVRFFDGRDVHVLPAPLDATMRAELEQAHRAALVERQSKELPLPGAPMQLVQTVFSAADNEVWIAGSAGLVMRYRDNAWQRFDLPTKAAFRTIFGTGPNEIWVAADSPRSCVKRVRREAPLPAVLPPLAPTTAARLPRCDGTAIVGTVASIDAVRGSRLTRLPILAAMFLVVAGASLVLTRKRRANRLARASGAVR